MTQQEFNMAINRGTEDEACIECELIGKLSNCVALMLDHLSTNGAGPDVSRYVTRFLQDINFRY